MRRLLIGVVVACLVAIGMAGVAESRGVPSNCPNGVCPTIQWDRRARTPVSPIQSMPGYVCRMTNSAGRIADCGTGTLIYKDARIGGVLSCKHILSDGVGDLSVMFSSINQRYKARLVAADPRCDLSFWIIQAPPVEPCPMATDYASTGQRITLLGLGRGSYRAQRGQVRGYTKSTNMGNVFKLSGGSRGGDSGGPVLNERGELTGVLWGTERNTTFATFIGDIHAFLCADRYAFPWNADLADKKDARKHEANKSPIPSLQSPLPQRAPVDLSEVKERLDNLESQQQEQLRMIDSTTVRLDPLEATADKARQLAEGWPELQAAMKKLEITASQASSDSSKAIESVTAVASKAAKAVESAAEANATVDAALDEDAPDGLVARLRGHARKTIMGMGIVEKFGAGPLGFFGLMLAAAAWFIRRDVKDKAATGDPLAITKLRSKLAKVRARLKAARGDEEE